MSDGPGSRAVAGAEIQYEALPIGGLILLCPRCGTLVSRARRDTHNREHARADAAREALILMARTWALALLEVHGGAHPARAQT